MKDKIMKVLGMKKKMVSEEKPDSEMDYKREYRKLEKENKILNDKICVSALEKFKSRRSIRRFSQRDVDWKIICGIIEGGLNAPCAGNVENVDIIVVSGKEERNEIGKIQNQQFWLSDAPYLLVVVRDNDRLVDLYPGEGMLYATQNSAAVVENILMLAHFYDLGACWVESCDNNILKDFLGVPGNMVVDAVIPIGYPLETPEINKSPYVAKVFFEKYGNKKRRDFMNR